jgi:hypothetical protein
VQFLEKSKNPFDAVLCRLLINSFRSHGTTLAEWVVSLPAKQIATAAVRSPTVHKVNAAAKPSKLARANSGFPMLMDRR